MSIFRKSRAAIQCIAIALTVVVWSSCLCYAAGPTATNPYAWYRADLGVTEADGVVSAWADQSGNSHDLVGIGTPMYVGGQIETDTGVLYGSFDSGFNPLAGTVFAVWSSIVDAPGTSYVYQSRAPVAAGNQHIGNEDPGSPNGSSYGNIGGFGIYPYNFPQDGRNLLRVSAASYTGSGNGATDFLTIWDLSGTALIDLTGNTESSGMNGIVIGGTVAGEDIMFHNLEGNIAEVLVYEGNLSAAEITEIRDVLIARWNTGLLGDYNNDDTVDAADYVVWRKSPGSFGGDPDGYNLWLANFGDSSAGSGSSFDVGTVPEPASIGLLFIPLTALALARLRNKAIG